MSDLPRTVHFVAQAPVLDFVGLFNTVTAPEFAPLGAFLYIAVLDQGGGFLRRSRSEVKPHQRLCTDQLAPCHEFVRAKLVGLNGVPGLVEGARPIFPGSDPIEPVIAGNEITAGIANNRNS